MNWSVIRALLGRDLGMIRRSKALMLPMLFLPTLLLVILPAAIGLSARERTLDVDTFVNMLPEGIAGPVMAAPPEERLIILVLGYMVAPLFLIVPLMVSSVLAADTFAGEKERKTLETLLHLPLSDRDLYVAKLLSTFLPSTAVAWVGFAVFCVVSNVVCWPVMGRIFIPTKTWMLVIFWLAPAVAALGLGVMVRAAPGRTDRHHGRGPDRVAHRRHPQLARNARLPPKHHGRPPLTRPAAREPRADGMDSGDNPCRDDGWTNPESA